MGVVYDLVVLIRSTGVTEEYHRSHRPFRRSMAPLRRLVPRRRHYWKDTRARVRERREPGGGRTNHRYIDIGDRVIGYSKRR
jgi:hypothetical protein